LTLSGSSESLLPGVAADRCSVGLVFGDALLVVGVQREVRDRDVPFRRSWGSSGRSDRGSRGCWAKS
jgi:hypothetical protein